MEQNLSVPYLSQWDQTAVLSNNDCGAAAVAMILNYYGENLTVDQVQQKTGSSGGLVTIEQLQKAITACGYSSEVYTGQTFDNLKNFLTRGLPVVALVHYGSLTSTQDKQFKGGHFFDVVGYRSDNSVYVNDPNFKDALRKDGDHHVYTFQEFMAAWGSCNQDGNPNNTLVVISKKVVDQTIPLRVRITPDVGLYLRSQPTIIKDTIIRKAGKEEEFDIAGKVTGDTFEKNYTWYEVKGGGFLWSGGVEPIAMPQPVPVISDVATLDKLIKERDLYKGEYEKAVAVIQQMTTLGANYIQTPSPIQSDTARRSVWDSFLALIRVKKG